MFDHIRADLAIIRERDPAARGWLEIVCCYPGFQAITLHRISHLLWTCHLPLKLAARCLSQIGRASVSYTHLRAHETDSYLVCRLLLEKKNTT